ncbi:cell division protein FtsQ/DivIB [Polymorphospora rubra]|uniref:cell division protein FtsQ/DivIB n=1 Tax=Polymorphospora rubra TaxID=338584 RepID=UPI0033DB1763
MTGGAGRGRPGGPAAGGRDRQGDPTRRWRLVRAGSDAVPPSVRRFMRRARQRRLRAALPWAVAGAVLALVGLSVWVVYGTGVFGVRDVRVNGTDLLTPDQVRAAAAVRSGAPLAGLDTGAIERRVGGLAQVERVSVSRDFPGTVVVDVVERTPVAVVPRGEAFVLVDASGVVFRELPARPDGLPLVRVAEPGPDDLGTRGALTVLTSLTDALRQGLVEVVVDSPARIRLLLAEGREVVWGDATDSATKADVATALLAREGDVIDVSAPDVVTIR